MNKTTRPTPYALRSRVGPNAPHHASRITSYVSRLTPHAPLLLILLLFTALTLYNSVTLPLGEAADETDHYQYLRFVAHAGRPPLTEAERKEAGFKGGLAPLYYCLTAWPIALVGEDTPPDIRRVDARPERHIPTDGLGINHVLHTLDEQWPFEQSLLRSKPWRGQILAWHLIRVLSLPMAWVTIIATYALARRLLPEQKIIAIGAAAFVAFLPRFVISSAVINDDNLVFALTALLLLTQVAILQGNHRPVTFAIFGALFGLSLVTKYFSLILIPEILFTLVVYYLASRQASKVVKDQTPTRPYIPLLAFLLTLSLITVPWFTFIFLRFNRINELGLIPGLAASLGEPQITEGLVGLFSGQAVRPPAATYSLPEWFSLLYRSFWFEYGWMQIFAPTWVYVLYTVFLVLALFGLIRATITPHASRFTPLLSPLSALFGLHLLLFVVVLLARYVLSATIDTSQGRHLYPALPVIALLISLGLTNLPSWHHPFKKLSLISTPYSLLLTGYLILSFFTLPPFDFAQGKPSSLQLGSGQAFILHHYHFLPVTITPPPDLPITYRQSSQLPDGFSLAGFDVTTTTSAGDVLPVTLYWRIEKEISRDYLISLCLQDDKNRPVACWRGHFANGHYPARAWEAGDTLADTIFIPIPTCYRLSEQKYNLHLELWPLAFDSPEPKLEKTPILKQTFTEPLISIQATDTLLKNLPQTVEFWQGKQRLTGPTTLKMNEALAQITYTAYNDKPVPGFKHVDQNKTWLSLSQLDTPLYLPCEEGPAPFARLAHFITNPTLASGTYQAKSDTSLPNITLSLRDRLLAPVTPTLTFSQTLAPLVLQLSDQPPIDLNQQATSTPPLSSPYSLLSTPYSLLPTPYSRLPITIHWQAHRWMADPLVISLKLLDKDFMIGGERIASLGDRYPNVLWVPTEIVEETYPLQIKPDAPPGLYQLELSLIRQDKNLPDGFEYLSLIQNDTPLGHNLYPVTVRLLDPAHDTPPPYPFSAQLGQAIHLIGYNFPQSPISNYQSPIPLTLYWHATDAIPTDYTVFTQLLGPDGQIWAQWDNPPQAGRYPTTAWAKNDTVVDRYTLTLREGAPPGDYHLLVGMYDPSIGQRLPAMVEGELQPDNAILLTILALAP